MNKSVLEAKSNLVEEVKKQASESTTVVVFEYRGLNVSNLTSLRKELHKADSVLRVYKNTLTKRAFEDLGHAELVDQLKGPNAILFSKDLSKGLKALFKFARRNEEVVIKAGLVEGEFADAKKLKQIQNIPNKEGLLSMLCSVLNAPVAQFARTIQAVADAKN